jgi:hypothetical protein
MNHNRARRYARRWRRYQERSDALCYSREDWFKGYEYPGNWLASWTLRRRALLAVLGSLADVTQARGWRGR